MTDLEFSFEESGWIAALEPLWGKEISATQFLTLMEGETEASVEEAMEYLESAGISLNASDLPRVVGTGQAAQRLCREEEWVKAGTLRRNLEENDPLLLYLQEVEANPVTGNLQAMAERFASGYDQVLPALTNAMLPVVIELSQNWAGHGVLLLDLIQEGSLGLWQGILSYQRGDFEIHARWWINQYLAKAITLQARESGVGQKMKQAMEDYRSVDERLLSDLGRNPTLEEIAQAMHMSVDETQAVSAMLEAARNLHRAKPEEKPEEEENPDEQQAVENTAYFQMRQRIAELLSVLDETDAKLLNLRFGLEGGLPLSPEDTAKQLNITKEEVLTREAAALMKMRNEG